MPESFGAPGVTPAIVSATQPMYWSVRRELWENRSIYLGPLIAGGLFLFGFLISLLHMPARMRAIAGLSPAQQHEVIAKPYDVAAGLMMVTAMIVGVFYCLDALHGERRDRSILFWKSLPVSDLTTVLSKASIPLVVLPLVAFTFAVALQVIVLLLSSAVLAGNGLSVAALWTQVSLWQMSMLLLYHLLAVHSLFHAPFYGWLLLVSAWARRAVFLWAFLPLLGIFVIEKIAFNSSYFANWLGYRLSGGGLDAMTGPEGFPLDPMTHITPGRFLTSAGLWLGLLVTAAFLVGAARLRRSREPI
jgi:ABC-2 type transport system permease protein